MRILTIALLTLLSIFLLTNNIIAEEVEVHGQILYRDGGPASYVQIFVDDNTVSTQSANRYGFYSVNLNPGEHTIKVKDVQKMIYVSPKKSTKVDFRISRD